MRERSIKISEYKNLWIAFWVPVLVCCIGFALIKVYPFGQKSALIIDGVHQYIGFYEELCHQLNKGSNWIFSEHGMGYNFYSVFSYYLSSPFNLLILILMQFMYVNEAVTIVILLKIGLTGVCMAWYVQKKTGGRKEIAVVIGCMYGLSNYILGYYSNIMWLDCVMLLPVLAWAIEEMVHVGKWKKYILVLGYCIISNYYFGFILCVFSVLYYQAVYAAAEKRKHSWIQANMKFVGSSILAGGLAGFILLPGVFAVAQTTAAKQAGISFTTETYGSIWEQLSRLLFDCVPYATSSDQSSLNIYCGCGALLFLSLFLFNKKIRRRKRLAMAGLLLFYFLGFHFATLNLLLHGFHSPVGMPNRFSFVFTFLLLSIGSEGWKNAEKIEKRFFFKAVIAVLLFCMFDGISTWNWRIWASAGILIIYSGLFAGSIFSNSRYKKGIRIVICILLLLEIGVHGICSIQSTGNAHRDLYKNGGEEIQQMLSTKSDKGQYRTTLVKPMLRNEDLLYGLNGAALFSSTNTDIMSTWMKKMGFETGKNRYQYTGGTEVTDMLLGVKYLACQTSINMDSSYQKAEKGEYFNLYENPRVLGSGYLVDPGIKDMQLQGNNPMEIQNNLLKQMGCSPLYKLNTVLPIKQQKTTSDTVYEINLKGNEHGYLWLEGREPSVATVNGRVQKARDWNNNFLDLGYSDQDRMVSVQLSSNCPIAVVESIQESQIDAVYQKLRQNEIYLQEGKGTIQADKNGVIFFSTFYDKGIHFMVDGKETKVYNLDGMTGVPIEKGMHEIQMSYTVSGLKAGVIISVLSLVLLGILLWNDRMKKKGKM